MKPLSDSRSELRLAGSLLKSPRRYRGTDRAASEASGWPEGSPLGIAAVPASVLLKTGKLGYHRGLRLNRRFLKNWNGMGLLVSGVFRRVRYNEHLNLLYKL